MLSSPQPVTPRVRDNDNRDKQKISKERRNIVVGLFMMIASSVVSTRVPGDTLRKIGGKFTALILRKT